MGELAAGGGVVDTAGTLGGARGRARRFLPDRNGGWYKRRPGGGWVHGGK